MTGPIGTGGFASLGLYGAESEATRAGRRQDEERQQYITKIPSSSFLRVPPERADRLTAADALFAVPVVSRGDTEDPRVGPAQGPPLRSAAGRCVSLSLFCCEGSPKGGH